METDFHQLPGRKARDEVFMSQVEPESAKRQAEQCNASPDRELGTPHLRSMLSTAELVRRPSRPPDYAAENRALIALAQVMATSPDAILQKLADTALTCAVRTPPGSAYWRRATRRTIFTGALSPGSGLVT